ncbi:MAG: GNAT family N-acetyltransferase [Actinomycetota bacterium]
MPVTIRPLTPVDLDAVLALNQLHVPAVGSIDADGLAHLVAISVYSAVADDDGAIVGALIGLDGPGRDYGSHNYAWFSERFDRFLYVDRVVVAESHHGQGLARRFYEGFIEAAADGHTHLLAEVNTRPRNEASLVFHDRLGFDPLDERDSPSGEVRVVMLARPLGPDAPPDDAGAAPDDAGTAPDRSELSALEGDVATVERVLDRFHELEPAERSTMLDALDGGGPTGSTSPQA